MTTWIFYSLLAAFFASLVAIFSKVGLENVDTHVATALRAFIMLFFITSIVMLQKKFHLIQEIKLKEYSYIFLAGISGGISWLFYFLALKSGPATKVAAIDRTSIIFVLIFSLIFLNEAFTLKTTFGIISILIGSILLVI